MNKVPKYGALKKGDLNINKFMNCSAFNCFYLLLKKAGQNRARSAHL